MHNTRIALLGPGAAHCDTQPLTGDPEIEVTACGICATDRKGFRAPPASMRLPMVPGHEFCGIHRASGRRVVVWPALACGTCTCCRNGRANLCAEIRLFGLHCDGGYQRYFTLPAALAERLVLLDIPPSLGWEQASLAEPLGCVIHAFSLLRNVPDSLRIFGAGLMGRLAARLVTHLYPECRLEVHDPDPFRQKGFTGIGSEPVAVVFPACSDPEVVGAGIAGLAPGGTMLLFSGLDREYSPCPVDYNRLHRKELTLVGSYGCLPEDMSRALDLMAAGNIHVDDLITERIGLEQVVTHLGRTPAPEAFKTIIRL